MTVKKSGLGRGLDALLSGVRTQDNASENTLPHAQLVNQSRQDIIGSHTQQITEDRKSSPDTFGLMELTLDKLCPGHYQPRQKFQHEELEHLAESIRKQGVLQPLVVRRLKGGAVFEIIAGERRFRAAQLAGLTTVPVIVKQVSDENALSIALIENIQRENLNPLEEAIAIERLTKEFKLTHIQVAEALGKSRTGITNSLRLLTLTEEVKAWLEQGEIEVGHAKVLLGLRGKEQTEIAGQIIARKLSVRETERLVAKSLEETENYFPKRQVVDPDVRRLQNELSEKLGTKLEIQHSAQGKGKLVIHYHNLEELQGILEHIK